nr:PREDICTED: dynein heavy chain 11, axonemal [Lepisosteus oculatus]
MADDDEEEQVPSFAEDERVQFVANKLCQSLKVKSEKWDSYIALEENQAVLSDFLERDTNRMLVFYITSAGLLAATREVSADCKHRGVYVLKKRAGCVHSDNYKTSLLFGTVSLSLLEQVSSTVEKIFVPVLSNRRNHQGWPNFTSQDVSRHVESLRNKVSVVEGQRSGRTTLPIPAATARIGGAQPDSGNVRDYRDRTVIHATESMVISWTHQIRDVLKEDSAGLLLEGFNPGPSAELDFWSSRRENLLSIHTQLQSPVVQKMGKILKMTDSSYYPTFRTTVMDVADALAEAQDVELHLQPLHRHLALLQDTLFPQLRPLLPPLFHTLGLLWTRCKSFHTPARIVVLLQEFCNLLIEQAIDYLSPEDLLKGEPEEALEQVQASLKVFRCFRETFVSCREKLAGFIRSGETFKPWDFPSQMVFTRCDRLLARLLEVEDLLLIMLEFQKLEKLEFGGSKGKVFSDGICKMRDEFLESCRVFKDGDYNPLDYNSQEFERHYEMFKRKVLDFDRRLATILYMAFNDCSGLESALKLLIVFGCFLERPAVKEIFSSSFPKVLQLFNQELERCKQLYDSNIKQVQNCKNMVNKNMPLTAGSLKWANELKERIQSPWKNLKLVYNLSGAPEAELVCRKFVEMLSLLGRYEEEVYSDWAAGVEGVCQFNLDQPLIKRDSLSGLLSVNFDPQLVAVLREVKYLQMLNQTNIPEAALAMYEKKEMFIKYVGGLELLVQEYNKLKQSVLEVELPLVRQEVTAIDGRLRAAEETLRWTQQGCWERVSAVKDAVCELGRRVQAAKGNVGGLQTLAKGWGGRALFCRRDGKRDALLCLEDRADRAARSCGSVRRDGERIHGLVEENRGLFRADPSSGAWKVYLEYVDEMVVDGLFCSIRRSLDFFIENTESTFRPAPLFEAQIILRAPEITFQPSLDKDAADGFYDLVDELLSDVFKVSAQVKRVAGHLGMEDYQHDMEDMLDLSDLRQEVLDRVDDVIRKAVEYKSVFEPYRHLWVDDRGEFMKQFLLYGHVLTTEEIEAYGEDPIPENPPSVDQFKAQIDVYENMYAHISSLEDAKVFESWFRVDIRSFKSSLLNTIKKWSWMFKEHLMTYVTESLNELEEFIKEADEGLQRPLKEGDYSGLVEVMGYLLAVRDRQATTDELFHPLKETIVLLEGYGHRMPAHVCTQLEELPEKWNNTKKIAVSVKHEVAPLQTAEVSVIRRKCVAFEMKQCEFRERFRLEAPFAYNSEKPYGLLQKANREIQQLEEEMASLQESSNLFEVSTPEYRQLKLCRQEIVILKDLWDIIIYVRTSVDAWTKTRWREVRVEQMEVELRRFAKDMWQLDKAARAWGAYSGLDSTVRNLLASLRAVTELQSPAIRERHWAQLVSTTGVQFAMTEDTTLAELLALQLHRVEEDVRSIVDKAVKEMGIEKVLTEITQTWTAMEFCYEDHYRTSTPLLKSDEELIDALEDNQVQLQAILQSKHVEHFLEQVSGWQRRLTVADSVILIWLEVQRTWAHLESIFIGSEDIRGQLPQDAGRFDGIDADFKELMFESTKTKNVIEATNKPHLFERLEDLQKRLAVCEKALADYLETKRLAFPRFYFVSSADLLDILSKGTQPKEVTRHLAKLFDNMADLQFESSERQSSVAVGMFSKEKEYVPFHTHCNCIGQVEVWLNRLEEAMRRTVRGQLAEALGAYEDKPREQWVLDWPAQVSLTGSQIWWTADVGIAFERLEEGFETALRDYNKKQIAQLNALINMLLGELAPGDRQKVMTICTIDVHARDVVAKLIAQKVGSSQAFAWLSQLRPRWDEEQGHCFANICDAQFRYSYEYLGNTSRLVITPLTDRCYITLTQSLHLTMSGAPAGPAGTGKTETTKDLGRALGIMVYVFNCSEQMDYKSIGNIYKGLAQTGAWGCFDEFNRISVEVLSVVAVQVKTIQDSIRNKRKRFLFLGEDIALKPSVGIFITMNPGYAGRTELPENLKALFRPCAMVVPDIELICEIMLVAEGFLSARLLARKFITLYTLCRELLSKQDHYDWGLRAVKSVLVVAGSLKRGDKNRPEDQVLMRALRDFNLPKIIADDVPIFMGLIRDLFPALEVPRQRDLEFEQMVRQSTLDLCLQPEESFVLKVIQLEELLAVRHSVFVVGNAGTGKSQVLKTLNRTYSTLRKKPVWSDLNPKAVATDELFGFVHPATREWKDGLLSCLLREQANLPHGGPKWIVLDGDIDPMWIESLNTVMDDNKVLTLASNERVPLTPSMRLLFEISHLRTATPATVSRAGILYVNPQDLGWNPGALLVHTPETVRLKYFVNLLLRRGKPVMLVGNGGVGKTVLVGDTLSALSDDHMVSKVPLNYYTTSAMLQRVLEKPLEKKAGRNYSPPGNKRLIYFIDDLNMPAVDTYGTVQPHTLIRQHLDYKHWYDRQKLTLKEVHNCQYVACMNPTAGSFTVNSRLQRHFAVFAVNFPCAEALDTIYSQILYVASWIDTRSQQSEKANLTILFEKYVPPCLEQLRSTIKTITPIPESSMVQNVPPDSPRELYEIYFVFACIWAFGGAVYQDQGILFSSADCLKQSSDLVRLWMHEASRVYSDKLVETKDCELFNKLLLDAAHKHFEGVEDHILRQRPLIYCHFANGVGESRYMPVRDWETLKKVLVETLESYNELNAAMNLVLFEDAMQHVCRISRILQACRGYALLVGVGGSGKQSLSRLAAHISALDVFQVSLRRGYGIQDLRVDLANLYIKTGAKNMPTMFLLTDAQVPSDSFLVLINDLLATGEIPELFSDEEEDGIVSGIRSEVRGLGLPDSRESCWKFFIDRVRQQLKVALCFSPVGSTLRVRARRFPAIVSCTAVDWFHEWPQEALQSVSRRFLEGVQGVEPHIQDSISLFMAHVHTSVNEMSEKYWRNEKRYNYTTPKSFLEQISLFRNLLQKKQQELSQKMERLVNGIQKLKTTASQVEDLKAKLASQEVELNLKNQDAEALISKIGRQTEKVSRERRIADAEEQRVAAIQAEVSARQKDCETDLAKAEPALVAATSALNTLNKVNLTELKTFPNPPAAVTDVAAAVMVLLAPRGRVPKDRGWRAAKAFMGKVDDFLQALVSYDKEHIPESCLRVVKGEYLSSPDFRPERVRAKSFAAAGLCAWVINIVKYYEVYCDVEPKRRALSVANTELETATGRLGAIRKRLLDLDGSLSRLTAQFEKATADKLQCQEGVTRTTRTIELANRLVRGLEAEDVRWAQAVGQLEAQRKTLCGDVLLTAAFVSYVGSFTRRYREDLLGMWIPFLKSQKVPIPLTEGLDPIGMLTDDATVAAWNNEGLPGDRMSAENAAILTSCARWPLLIDPQQQGIKWVQNKYGADLKAVRLGQKGYLDTLERALACGETVLIENLEETVDPILDPLLGRNTIKKGRYIKIGDKECEYSSGFRLILHTKLANPHFQPETQAQTTLINFTVTRDGLEEQLLAGVVSAERPDLERLKSELTKQQNDFKIELKRLEDELLTRLSTAEGSFLGDNVLVEKLERTKQTATEIEAKVLESQENERKINEARELYRPTARRASILYFIINDLSKINPMYQFSLKTAFQILLTNKTLDPQELDFLLRFPVEQSSRSPVDFLSPQSWGAIKTMSAMDEFRGLDKDIEGSAKRWKKLVESECPEKERFPQEWKNKSSLQKVIMLRALRPDRVTYAIRNFVEESMGSKYVEGMRVEFEKSFEESSPATPVFFILSPGVNPLTDVESLGKKLGFRIDLGKLHNVSLGQGQEVVAEAALLKASREGHWVILQNVHLVAGWLGTLEKLLASTSEDSHPDYRVFISAEPAATPEEHIIPQGILENSIKITNEPPAGLLANLHAALYNFDQDTLEMCAREQEFKSILFSLCYFHACVAERRKFGPQGWNLSYPFNTGDLTISANVLYNYLEANSKVPWEDLRYLFGEIMYGGHITDDWDRRLCRTYLEEFMNPAMLEGGLFLCPGFPAPPNLDYLGYHEYIDDSLPPESPALYGLHPNAEIEFLTATSDALLRTLLGLRPPGSADSEVAAPSAEEQVKNTLDGILEQLPEEFNLQEIMQKTPERSPYILVCLQECERMNLLIEEVRRSLKELDLGLKGELTISSKMEVLQLALYYDNVPDSWTRLANPSTYSLAQWFSDLLQRCRELDTWTQDLVLPAVVWLSGLFNPQSFLTAIMQSIARKNEWPLDKMRLTVDVTKKTKEDYGHPPREGSYVHGLYMEGARWDSQSGLMAEAHLKDRAPALPVLLLRAGPADRQEPAAAYECPVYRTRARGPTYVWTFPLKTKEKPAKWVLGGVALLLSV